MINHTIMLKMALNKRCHKFLLQDGGYIYIEKFDSDPEKDKENVREEDERAKIYDERGTYLDYICLDGLSNAEYWSRLSTILSVKDGEDLILNKLDIGEEMVTGEDIREVLLNYAETFDKEDEEREEILERLIDKNWSEDDLMSRYCIQKVGICYFIVLV